MENDHAQKPTGNTKAQIRRAAIRGACFIACFVAAYHLYYRRGVLDSTAVGFAAGLGGLLNWYAYHRISGRNDGLYFVGMTVLISSKPERDMPAWFVLLASLFLLMPIAVGFGFWNRGLDRKPHQTPEAS
jgi:hypothetical protein